MPNPSLKTALMVSQDPDTASEIQSLLHDLGYKVTKLQDPSSIEDQLAKARYQLVILNQVLQGMSWHQTLRTVKRMALNSAVIVMASSAAEVDIRDALSAGSYAVLDRPLAKHDMASLIDYSSGGLFLALR